MIQYYQLLHKWFIDSSKYNSNFKISFSRLLSENYQFLYWNVKSWIIYSLQWYKSIKQPMWLKYSCEYCITSNLPMAFVVKWWMKQTKLTSEISYQTDSCLAQLVRHWPEDPEVLVSIPTGGNFWRIFFCSSLCKDLSDNLTETPIVKNSNV